MKKTIILAAIAAITLTSCSSLSNSTSGSGLGNLAGNILGGGKTSGSNLTGTLTQAGGNMLSSLLGNLLGTNTVTDKTLVGSWNYKGVDCVFESENFLSKAGGELAAATLENKVDESLQKFGIKPGAVKFTFNADHTWTGTIAGKSLSGKWTLDEKNSQVKMTYLMGMGTLTPKVALNNGTLSLLFESSKLLTLVQGVGALTGNSTVSSLTSLMKNYNGMYIGLQMTK